LEHQTFDEPVAVGLGRYVASPAAPSPGLIDRARLHVLDTIGCMVGATQAPSGRRILALTEARGCAGRTTTIGLSGGRRLEDSALANGTLAHMLEFDDGHRPSDNHLGCVVVPAALALAEETDASLASCLEATIVGYDVMGRTGEATLLPRNETCFHGTGTTGVFGAAAVAARLLGLDAMQAAQSFAIAGTAAAGLRESMNNGPECKPLHAGRATQNGITAAYLASAGYTGPLTVFEGVHGFCNAMCNNPRPELILDGLGERFSILEAGFKVHSTCGMLFNVLDGVLDVRTKHGLDTSPPPQIRVGVPSWIVEDPPFGRRRPESGGEARFSIPFAVAVAIADGEVSMRQMTAEKLLDPYIAELEGRVHIDYDDEVEEIYQRTKADSFFYYPAAIEFEQDGRTHRSVYTNPRGYDPTIPLTREELVAKFHSTVDGILDADAAAQVVELVLEGPGDTPVSAITKKLVLA
jgi:2-methylcitrate dehydratase PrpD